MIDSATRVDLARSLKARLGAQSAKGDASSTSLLKSKPSPPSLPSHSTETPDSPHSHQTPNSPLTSQTPSIAQTPNSPPTLQTPSSAPPIAAVPLAAASVPSVPLPTKARGCLSILPRMTTRMWGLLTREGGPIESSTRALLCLHTGGP